MALLEARPYRPFKSSEEYLEAMKEDLAEWLSTLYPDLMINAENFMDRLDTGVALCKHANHVRQAAEDYLARRQARNKSMTRSMTSGLAGPILAMGTVHYLPAAKSGTFFSRDNVSNFITWCKKSLKIIECLLFETDDLIMRKNEKHVILCLLEVARRGAKFGMLAPMLVQMERQIDREIAADNKANGIGCGIQTEDGSGDGSNGHDIGVGTDTNDDEADLFDTDSENGDEDDDGPMLMYGPQPQIITNDLKSLDEMVRDLVEKCTCPSQFPMVRVSEGKYRIGDTKVLIFVRILRSHVMVRVGGGWDTLSHYLDKHDPCRCRAQHRSSVAARLIPRANNQTNGIELHKAQVIFERSPPAARKIISAFNNQTPPNTLTTSPAYTAHNNLSPMNYGGVKNRSRSPTPQRKFLNQLNGAEANNLKAAAALQPATNIARRSMSPSPRRLIDIRKKQTSLDLTSNSGPKSLPNGNEQNGATGNHVQFDNLNPLMSTDCVSNTATIPSNDSNTNGNKFENISDNGSEISDEGYRSLGVIQSNAQKRESLHSQTSMDDAETNARLDQTSSDSQLSPVEDSAITTKSPETLDTEFTSCDTIIDAGPQSLPAVLSIPVHSTPETTKFEQNGIFISDDEITVNIASNTGLRKTDYSSKLIGGYEETVKGRTQQKVTNLPRSPIVTRRRSCDNSGSLQDLHSRTGLPVLGRNQPAYRSVRKPANNENVTKVRKPLNTPAREITNTWSGRSVTTNGGKKRPTINADTFTPVPANSSGAFERNIRTRSSAVQYDSNGRRIKGCTASLTTSPVKNMSTSPLAQQLLEAASSAKNDAQILEKMKTLLSRYGANKNTATSVSNTAPTSSKPNGNGKKPIYEDFTSAWVHSNGNLERSSSCSPPTKARSKRSSAASSTESTHSYEQSVNISPRRERGKSKIPGPIRQHTELY